MGDGSALDEKNILITGGTGQFGNNFVEYVFTHFSPKKIIILSRDEKKQEAMRERYRAYAEQLRFFIGDVRDLGRLKRAFEGVDYVIHAAAMKDIEACEYNPQEAVKTDIGGTQNVIEAALDTHVKKVIALSTDKAVNPISLYGGVKFVSDRLMIAANSYSGHGTTAFSVVRYSNVAGSQGSVIPVYRKLIKEGNIEFPITDFRMTRFWTEPTIGVTMVLHGIEKANGGEIFIAKSPSYKITDLAEAMLPGCRMREVGLRDGEKLSEIMVTKEEAEYAYEYQDFYVVYPFGRGFSQREVIAGGVKLERGFEYSSNNNTQWLSCERIRELLEKVVECGDE